ncbi:MAG: helicase-related protein [Anaerolineae bacterium]
MSFEQMPQGLDLPQSGLRDNFQRGSVGEFLREKIQPGSTLSLVSAYFTIYAYAALQDRLDTIEHVRFLFGEPRFVRTLDPARTDKKAYRIEDSGLELSNRLQQGSAARACAAWIRQKVEIRSIRQANLLHGKMVHIATGRGSDGTTVAEAILGSSNFTLSGLGLAHAHNNIELNLVVDNRRDRQDLLAWFDALWNDTRLVEDVRDEVLAYLAQLYQDNTPEFIYFKTLFHLFEAYLSEQAQSSLLAIQQQIVDTDIWKALFEFQKDGVKGAINKMLAYNGCILADSVGLGKTYEALAIIKYFELRNERVLVLCPKKLRDNWTVYQAHNNSDLNPFGRDRFRYTVLSHTDLSRDGGHSGDVDLAALNWGNYDLVVIDESHNFRNNAPGRKDESGALISRSRYQRLMEDIIQAGVRTKVLLLSATPVNNTLKDLRNQIYFITENQDDALHASLGIGSIQETLRVAQLTFNDWATRRGERKTSELLERLSSGFFKLLDGLTIARSRRHVQKFYRASLAQLGGFPERRKPLAVYPAIDLHDEFMSYDRLNDEIERYQLSLFNPSRYVRPEQQAKYATERVAQFSQATRENYLIGMMKVNFLKRLESSVHAFDLTLTRTIQKMDDLRTRIRRFQQFQAANPDLDFDELAVEDVDDEELAAALEVSKARFKLAHLDLDRWLADLRRDRQQLHILELSAREITPDRDAKLAELKRLISQKAHAPTTDKLGRPNRKVLVFTAFADTAVYLYDAIHAWARQELGLHVALVTGGGAANRTTLGRNDFSAILTNFAPVSKHRGQMRDMPQADEIDLLIATDCISEGQNLQDCDTLVNYDIHWNPVRVIQRFGRIDRIGSIHHAVQLINFWPTQDLDKYISLKVRVEARMALVDLSATADDNLLNVEELEDLITEDLKYRDRQLKRLREEVLDLEDFSESVALTDFTLDDFRAELTRYIEANRQALQDAPLGLFTVVPPHPDFPVIQPGAIFCLRQAGVGGSDTVNPLQPYFLVYILNDGIVRFSFTHPKQILEILRALCAGRTQPYEALCRLFDQETQQGNDMAAVDDLLRRALVALQRGFGKRAAGLLLQGRDAVLPGLSQQVTEQTEFELVTWVVVKQTAGV